MYFYVDESGHTGANLFDEKQPILYYGVLSSQFDIDALASDAVADLRKSLGVERLHAAELGISRLAEISNGLIFLQKCLHLNFDLYSVRKLDHAAICFFDQVFDQGMNPAVPWLAYWSPLRYILLLKIAALFDLELLKKVWNARIHQNDDYAANELATVCQILLSRMDHVDYDERSRQILKDSLTWASNNPKELQYNTKSKRERYWVTPNLIGFQLVMQGIAYRIKNSIVSSPPIITVDQQSQFNQTQRSLAEFYAEARDFRFDFGTGLPEIDYTGMPETPILFKSGNQSTGLEIVDIYLWLFKRIYEKKEIGHQLRPLVEYQLRIGIANEVSLNAISERWLEWFGHLPDPTPEQWEAAKKMLDQDEQRRLVAISADKQTGKLSSLLDDTSR